MNDARLTIGEVADLLGITPKAIRHYHELGLLAEPARSEGGYRLYQPRDLTTLQAILRLGRFGLSLRQIGFILHSEDSDALLGSLLRDRNAALDDEIARLQRQRHAITAFLDADERVYSAPQTAIGRDAATVVYDTIKPLSNGLAEVIVQVEASALTRLDSFQWPPGYDEYWNRTASALAARAMTDERQIMLWLERYLTLREMTPDDLQARAWLNSLRDNPARGLLRRCWNLPILDSFADSERIQRVMFLLLNEDASALQREFLTIVLVTPIPD